MPKSSGFGRCDNMMIKLPWLSLILLLVAQTARTESQIEVQKTEEPNSRETIYTATSGSCGIEWILRRFSENSGFGISERSKCKLPLVSQIPFRVALLLQVVADTNNMYGMRNFFWGRLQRGDSNDEYALRLASAAANSSHWNSEDGTTRNYPRGINRFVAEILNQENVFAEVSDTFHSAGFAIAVNDVEKVLIGKGSAGNGQVPIDCTVTFSVVKQSNGQ